MPHDLLGGGHERPARRELPARPNPRLARMRAGVRASRAGTYRDRRPVARRWVADHQRVPDQLRSTGQPGVGDAFLRAVLTRRADPSWCTLVPITPHAERGFEEYPEDPDLASFDPSDRKFVAVALAGPQPAGVLNAVESDWWDHREALERNGVHVEFLCPRETER